MMTVVHKLIFITGLFLFATSGSARQDLNTTDVQLAPGWGKLSFEAPVAGTYQLPALEQAAGGTVLNTSGDQLDLASLYGDKVTLLSFIYRTCDDINGCPLSTMVLYNVSERVAEESEIQNKLRLITLSFDPEGDTPEAMQEYEESIVDSDDLDWHFLTSESDAQIQPILNDYQQMVIRDKNTKDGSGKFSHILRVYLIDTNQQIRNIYSLSFLHPDILVNDVKTLILEQLAEQSAAVN